MARSKTAPGSAGRPSGNGAPERRSGQGAGSALREMLRRQSQNPRPGAGQGGPPSGEPAAQGPQAPSRKLR